MENETIITEEQPHSGLILLFICLFVCLAQFGLYQWKKQRYSSFRNITLLGMWLIPLFWSIYFIYWRMITIWILFSFITGYIIKIATKKPLEPQTPRKVYVWFYRLYQLCSSITILGYIIVMIDYFLIPGSQRDNSDNVGQYGVLLAFYGVYYGVLGRDCSEMCADWMASFMGVIYLTIMSIILICSLLVRKMNYQLDI